MPVLEGVYSRGGRWVKGWVEVGDYYPVVQFASGASASITLDLSERRIDRQIFQLLSETIPGGGHFMFAYEVSFDSALHRETQTSLLRGIPAVCTAQGGLLFWSGFRFVKDWYLAEGGHEGPRKLWGEKPSNDVEFRFFDQKTFFQLLEFLSRKPNAAAMGVELESRRRASEVLRELVLGSPLSALRDDVIQIYRERSQAKNLEEAADRTCQHLEGFAESSHFEDEDTRSQLNEISKLCIERLQED